MVTEILITVSQGNFSQGFPISIDVTEKDDKLLPTFKAGIEGNLLPNEEIEKSLKNWQRYYKSLFKNNSRIIKVEKPSSIYVPSPETVDELKQTINKWLNSATSSNKNKNLISQLRTILKSVDEEIHIIIRTSDNTLRQLPWHLWDFFEDYPKSEFALSDSSHERISYEDIKEKRYITSSVNILAVLGNNTDVNILKDSQLINKIRDARVDFLNEPTFKEIDDQLHNKQYDIFIFAGHSSTQENVKGYIAMNDNMDISINDLKGALKYSARRGLKLAIFNSCDGLGIATELISCVPNIIIMREMITDLAAQAFLEFFIQEFSKKESLFVSMRYARERLKTLENKESEDNSEFICASWLPTIFYNPSEEALTWDYIRYGKERNHYKLLIMRTLLIFLFPMLISTLKNFNVITLGKEVGVNLNLYCEKEYGSGFKAVHEKESDPDSWSCEKEDTNIKYKITKKDIEVACQQQHNSNIVRLVGRKTVWDWKCVVNK